MITETITNKEMEIAAAAADVYPPCKDSVLSGAIMACLADPETSESEFAKGVEKQLRWLRL